MAHGHHGIDVQLYCRELFFKHGMLEIAGPGDTRVVHQQSDPSQSSYSFDNQRDSFSRAEVRDQRQNGATVSGGFPRQRLEPLLPARHREHSRFATREGASFGIGKVFARELVTIAQPLFAPLFTRPL
jgi:hypothetical protein